MIKPFLSKIQNRISEKTGKKIVSYYDIIRKLSEFRELSEDYIAEMPVKLGLY
jgi:hypothetical protein